MTIQYVTIQEIIYFNAMLIDEHGGEEDTGVRDLGLLESAVNRPKQTMLGKDLYPTVFHKAAALFESIAKNHAFHNANKRTAFLSMVVFLEMNAYVFEMDQKAAEDFTVDVVTGACAAEHIADIIEQHCVPL
ncbi:type II toxin-antitoxin system death-on-curing family toxin [Paenibacillus sp. WLX2291]|uniref:type II toxin-antitoxin system death-on-curing family toxin n=1 Tax=Paenibacillus sp. WLX2291 TaxID=3296934 RepID=UPI0039840E5A